MYEHALDDVDFAKYQRWLARVLGQDFALAACNLAGTPLWASDNEGGAALREQLRALEAAGFDWPFGGSGFEWRTFGERSNLLYRPIELAQNQRLGLLVLTIAGLQPDAAATDLDNVAEALDDITAAIADECRLHYELGSVTEELAHRYEELHLLYRVDEQLCLQGHRPELIENLLKNCAEQLGVDVVALTQPVAGLCLSAALPSKPIHNLDLVLVELRGDLFRFIQASRDSVVLNDGNDPRRAYIFTDMPYKVLACPIRQGNTIDGALVLINHDDKPNFTNSDRRLAEILANQLSSLLQSMALVQQLAAFNRQMASALVEAVEAKDPYTRGHSERVNFLSMEIGRALGLADEELEDLHWGSLLHDVGKIGIPDAVLCKPSRLTSDEYSFIMVHPERSYEILRHIDYLKNAVQGARHHQEKFDGTGYPHGLKGERIPLHGRIIAVADTYDSITSSRAYRPGRSHEVAMKEVERVCGSQLDPALVAVFREVCAAEPDWLRRFGIRRERQEEAQHG
ncbi:MAG: HD domain-containing phosphohydrolase [Candidatus Methylophosphatis roskildensis]